EKNRSQVNDGSLRGTLTTGFMGAPAPPLDSATATTPASPRASPGTPEPRSAGARQWWRSSPQPRRAWIRQLILAAARLARQAALDRAAWRFAVVVAAAFVLGGGIFWLLSGGGQRPPLPPIAPPAVEA